MSENFVEKKDDAKDKQRAELSKLLGDKLQELNNLSNSTPLVRARMQLDAAELLVALESKLEAWILAREAFDSALQHDAWTDAVEACDVLYKCEQADSVAALGMGVWLAVSFPVDPELTMALLIHIVDETQTAQHSPPSPHVMCSTYAPMTLATKVLASLPII